MHVTLASRELHTKDHSFFLRNVLTLRYGVEYLTEICVTNSS